MSLVTRDVDAFLRFARDTAPDLGPATAPAAFLVSPDGFARADESARDNAYMADAGGFDRAAALRQHRELHRALSAVVPTIAFPGRDDAPDGLFPNNVFATARVDGERRLIVARMRHPVRQREADRVDIRSFFRDALGCREIDLSMQPHPCELTGALAIDRGRGLGFCGLSERCDEAGARLMHDAFGLRATLLFDLAPGEYHTNVVLAVLGGRAALACPAGFADDAPLRALRGVYGAQALELDAEAHAAFAGNAIALGGATWMSARAAASLRPEVHRALEAAALPVRRVDLAAIEAAGGSLRCCVAEVF